MTPAVWRNVLHKFIVATGFMALTAIVAGAHTTGAIKPSDWTYYLFEPPRPIPSPYLASSCENGRRREDMLNGPTHARNPASCTSGVQRFEDGLSTVKTR